MKLPKEILLFPALMLLLFSWVLWNIESFPLLQEFSSRLHFHQDLTIFRLHAQDLLENPQLCRRTLQNYLIFYDELNQKYSLTAPPQTSQKAFPLSSQKLKVSNLWLEKAHLKNTVSKVDNKTYSVLQTQLVMEVTAAEAHLTGVAKIPLSITTDLENPREILDCVSVSHQ